MSSNSSSSDTESIIAYYWYKKNCKKHRKVWVRQIFANREDLGEFHHLVPQLLNDTEKFYNYYRMNIQCYRILISKVEPLFHIGHTNFRKTISFEERLTVTLRFLIIGESYHSLSYRFRISHNRISVIVNEILLLIYEALQNIYLKFPTKHDFEKVSEGFLAKKKFPNCLGAIDGKHVRIRKPFNAGSLYYNYKHYHSIVLLAAVDADYKFIMIDVGSYGKNSDGGILEHSEFGKLLYENKLDIPKDKAIDQNSNEAVPYVFIGDEAFRLSQNLLKPYPRRELDILKRRYNYRLSYARQIVECTFGILATKFRILDTSIAVSPEKVDNIIKAVCVLHNMIRVEEHEPFDETVTYKATYRAFESVQEVRRYNVNQSTRMARAVRDKFCNYFSGAGSVEWQDARIQINDQD